MFLSDFACRRLFNGGMTDCQQLLSDYVRTGSEEAFRELVGRYLDLVHSTALRLTNGDAHLAEDVCQSVFTDLARMAASLSRQVRLGGWLHRHTCYVVANVIRRERRRQAREREAVEMNSLHHDSDDAAARLAPVVDEAINQLRAGDRAAILLRFFDRRDLRAIGEAFGTTEDAAQKRVSRALEKLRAILVRRGVTLSATALATTLTAQAVTAAPTGLAASVSASALAGSAASGAAFTMIKLMTLTKLKTAALGALVVVGAGTTIVLQQQTQSRLHHENLALQAQVEQFAALQSEYARLSNQLAKVSQSGALSKDQLSELMRLRGEVGQLRNERKELEKLRAENRPRSTPGPRPAAQPETPTEQNDFPKESWAFVGYADPESAFQSTVWALSNGDVKTMLASMTPDELARAHRRWADKSEAEIAANTRAEFEKVKGFRILKKEARSDDEVVLTLYVEGLDPNEGTPRMKLQRVGNEWRVAGPDRDPDKDRPTEIQAVDKE
jgi:RNA polymerase sigma factor (sigma-70 family)